MKSREREPRPMAKSLGRPKREAIARREAGETLMDIARSYNVGHGTISRLS
jgi:hypothetical protein